MPSWISLFLLLCSGVVNNNWLDSPRTVLDIYHELIHSGLRIWMFRFSQFPNLHLRLCFLISNLFLHMVCFPLTVSSLFPPLFRQRFADILSFVWFSIRQWWYRCCDPSYVHPLQHRWEDGPKSMQDLPLSPWGEQATKSHCIDPNLLSHQSKAFYQEGQCHAWNESASVTHEACILTWIVK